MFRTYMILFQGKAFAEPGKLNKNAKLSFNPYPL
jgi:hypothetical protein